MIKSLHLVRYATATASTTEIIDGIDYPQRVHYCPEVYRGIRTGLKYPVHEMVEKVMDSTILEYLNAVPKKTCFILSAGSTSFAGLRNTNSKWNPVDFRFLPLTLTPVYAGKMAQRCGATDMVIIDSSACSSSLKVLMDAQMLATLHGIERFVILSVEDQVNETVMKFFGELQAVVSKEQEENGLRSSAFDSVNYGFNVGQGAVLAVFETEPTSDSVELLGAYTSGEVSSSAIGQREDGQGFMRAAMRAMAIADVDPTAISVVKTHGTGTKSNNQAEKAAIYSMLGYDGYVATSFKPSIGHTFGASGLLESCLLFDSIRNFGTVPAIANRTEQDRVFLSSPSTYQDGLVLSLAAGMGNIYSAAIWSL